MEERIRRIELKVDIILIALEALQGTTDHVSEQTDRVAAHVPFVDNLKSMVESISVRRFFGLGSASAPAVEDDLVVQTPIKQ